MEVGGRSRTPESKEESLKEILLRKAEEKEERALRGRGKGYSPERMENVGQSCHVVRECLGEVGGNYGTMTEIIAAMNEQPEREENYFPTVGDQIDSNGKFEILAIHPPGISVTDVLDAFEQTLGTTSFVSSGVNLWDNPFNPKQVFLPGSYILKEIQSSSLIS